MKITKVSILVIALLLVFSAITFADTMVIKPLSYPTEVELTLWNDLKTSKITQVEEDQNFIIKLNLEGGNGKYDVYIDFGDGHTLKENDFVGGTFETSYNYHSKGKKNIYARVTSLHTDTDEEYITVVSPK